MTRSYSWYFWKALKNDFAVETWSVESAQVSPLSPTASKTEFLRPPDKFEES